MRPSGEVGLLDSRPEREAQIALQAMADRSPQVSALAETQVFADARSRAVAPRDQTESHGEEPVQRMEEPEEEPLEKPPLQGRFAAGTEVAQRQSEKAGSARGRGLPPDLRAGMERLSGLDLSDLRVHYRSPAPARVDALAFTQGRDIHVAPGQERHLPHEAWHAVQQKQGRVRPTRRAGGVTINDDARLEREADAMGQRAQGFGSAESNSAATLQRRAAPAGAGSGIVQRVRSAVADSGETKHTVWGAAQLNLEAGAIAETPVLVEVMEYKLASARDKIDEIARTKAGGGADYRAIMIALNKKAKAEDYEDDDGAFKSTAKVTDYEDLTTGADGLANRMLAKHVNGGAFPVAWSPSDPTSDDVYGQFPFLEMRARVPLHAGTLALAAHIKERAGDKEVVGRSMDADVSSDALLSNEMSARTRSSLFSKLEDFRKEVVSGGYNWASTHPKGDAIWGAQATVPKKNACNFKLRECIAAINHSEHLVRMKINAISSQAVYWPEPNTYMMYELRRVRAPDLIKAAATHEFEKSQQREAVAFLSSAPKGSYSTSASTTKPLKAYFDDNLIAFIKTSLAAKVSRDDIKTKVIAKIRQSHLRLEKSEDTFKWHTGASMSSALSELIKGVTDPEVESLASRLYRILNTDHASLASEADTSLVLDILERIHSLESGYAGKSEVTNPLETLEDIIASGYPNPMADKKLLALRLERWADKNLKTAAYSILKRPIKRLQQQLE